MSGAAFLAGLAHGAVGDYMNRQEKKREEESQRRQMTVGLLGSLLHDENLSPDEHTHVVRMLFDSAGIKGKDADRVVNSIGSFGDIVRSWSGNSQSPQPSAPPSFTSNRITLDPDQTWREPPATSKLVPGGSLSLRALGNQPQPAMTTTLPDSAPPSGVPDVPGAPQPGFAAGLNDSLQSNTSGQNRQPTPEELQAVGSMSSPTPFTPLKRPDNYDSLPPRLQKIVDRKIKDQQETYGNEMSEMGERLRLMGGSYRQGADTRLDSLVTKYGASPKRPSAGGFNPQKVKVAGNEIVYVEDPSVPPLVLHRAGMTEADKQRNAISLAQVNAYRARIGEDPLMFAADLPTLPGSTSDSSGIPDVPGATPASASPVSPSTLVPVPGAKVPAVPIYRGYRRRGNFAGSGQSAGQSKSEQIAETTSLSAIRDVGRLRVEAASSRMRGETDAANEADAAADAVVDSTLKARKGNVEVVMGASGKRILRLKGSGTVPDVPGSRGFNLRIVPGTSAVQGRQYTEAQIRQQAISEHKDPDAAVRWAIQNKRLKLGN